MGAKTIQVILSTDDLLHTTDAQRTRMVQHLMLYRLQITKIIPETFSTCYKFVETISELGTFKNVSFQNRILEIIPKTYRNIKNVSQLS